MSAPQVLFGIAVVIVALIITAFALYVASSTWWGDRCYRRRRPDDSVTR